MLPLPAAVLALPATAAPPAALPLVPAAGRPAVITGGAMLLEPATTGGDDLPPMPPTAATGVAPPPGDERPALPAAASAPAPALTAAVPLTPETEPGVAPGAPSPPQPIKHDPTVKRYAVLFFMLEPADKVSRGSRHGSNDHAGSITFLDRARVHVQPLTAAQALGLDAIPSAMSSTGPAAP